jgi:hypothetical protein
MEKALGTGFKLDFQGWAQAKNSAGGQENLLADSCPARHAKAYFAHMI